MNLRKTIVIESLFFIVFLFLLIMYLEVIPSLQPSKVDEKTEPYKSAFVLENIIKITEKDFVIVPFKYPTYDPAIILLDVNFRTCERPGYLEIYCNYRKMSSIFIDSSTPEQSYILFSFSGSDWVEPPTSMFGYNELLFMSDSTNGFAGEIFCSVTFRGTR